jgi:acyl-CoA synthetase (AMP-forming)/AMP-acid ligase II
MTFSLASLVRGQRLNNPTAPMLSFEGTTYTYDDMDVTSSQVANALTAEGVKAGDRVAVLSKNVPEFFQVAFACSKIGAILVGLNWRLSAREIAAIITDAAPTVIIAGQPHEALLTSQERVVWLGEQFDSWRDAAESTDPEFQCQPDDVCLLLYTSGTTGLPKGVMLTNRSMELSPQVARVAWSFDTDSVNLLSMPLFHIGGIGYGISSMCFGGHTVLLRDVDPAVIFQCIEQYKITHAFFVPAVINMLLNTEGVETTDFSSLQRMVYGASPIGDAVLRRAIDVFGCAFSQAYGMTETSGTVVSLPPADHNPEGPRTHLLRACGKPLPWTEVRLIDPKTMTDVVAGGVGELWLRSQQVMAGYWNNPSETAAAISPEGWLRTGDAATQDDDGYIYLVDRFKDMIVSGAENIYPAEVENVLGDHPAVSEVAVIGVPHERWGETVKAIVVLRSDKRAEERELIDFTRARLATYKCPTSIEFAESLPRNASGKLLKKDLRKPYWIGHDRAVN